MHNPPSHACCRSATEPSAPGGRIHREARRAFTLVELMVVIVIIGLITAVAVPVVMQALTKARNAAIKAEIDMLHMAIMNYRNEYGGFPPCIDPAYGAGGSPYAAGGPAAKHLGRLFPRCANPTATGVAAQFAAATQPITPRTAIVSWLGGYTADPTLPLTGGARKRLFDFDQARVDATTLSYFPSGKSNAPYVYIDSSNYFVGSNIPSFPIGTGTYFAHRVPSSSAGTFSTLTQPAFNPDTFQILCAGRDEIFGNDDDLSNFWPGTRKDYLDSLK